jgi:hypothetical protein
MVALLVRDDMATMRAVKEGGRVQRSRRGDEGDGGGTVCGQCSAIYEYEYRMYTFPAGWG